MTDIFCAQVLLLCCSHSFPRMEGRKEPYHQIQITRDRNNSYYYMFSNLDVLKFSLRMDLVLGTTCPLLDYFEEFVFLVDVLF